MKVTHTPDESQKLLRPLASLIIKSEKAQQKLTSGSWQHTMLQDNLKALRIASALMNGKSNERERFKVHDFQETMRALASMIGKTEKAMARFSPGSSHHTLQQNRLKALRKAEELIKGELE